MPTHAARVLRAIALSLVTFLGVTPQALADDELGSLAWFKAAWEDANNWQPDEPVYVEFHYIERSRTSQEFVREKHAEIEGKPDHPQRYLLDQWALDARLPERTTRYRFWIADDIWRMAIDYPEAIDRPPGDIAVNGREGWSVTDGYLQVYSLDQPPETNTNDPYLAILKHRIQSLFFRSFSGTGQPSPNRPIAAQIQDDGTWVGTIESDDGKWGSTYHGVIAEDGTDIRIDACRAVKTPFGDIYHDGFDVLEWGSVEHISGPVPLRVAERMKLIGRPDVQGPWPEWVLVAYEPIDRDTVRQLVRTPETDGLDALRSGLEIENQLDFRPGQMTRARVKEGRLVDPQPIDFVRLTPASNRLRFIGWIIGPVVLVGGTFAALWIRSRRSL